MTRSHAKVNGQGQEPMDHVVVIKSSRVCIANEAGGTETLPSGLYKVRVTRKWHDREISQRCSGVLVDPSQISIARKVGTIPEETIALARKHGDMAFPEMKDQFHPEVVYFPGSDVVGEE